MFLITISFFFFITNTIFSQTPHLNSLTNFDLFTSSGALTNIGLSVVSGTIGTNGGAISGYSVQTATQIQNTATSQASTDLSTLYDELFDTAPTVSDHPLTFGTGEILLPGIYNVGGAISIAGTLTLDGQGNENALFIIKTPGALNAAAYAKIVLINGANANNVFWLATGAAGFATFVDFKGIIVSNAAIAFGAYSKLEGKAFTKLGAITTLDSYINVPFPAANQSANLGTASQFIMYTAAGAITNAGTSSFTGLIGTKSGAISGFPESVTIMLPNEVTAAAKIDLFSAYADLQGRTATATHSVTYATETLTPGIYNNVAAVTTTGILTLDGQGDPNSIFVFQFGAALGIAAASEIVLINGAHAFNVFWIVEGAVTIGANSKLQGTFISNAALGLGANCTLNGRVLILAGAITGLDGMTLQIPKVQIYPLNQTIDYGSLPADIILIGSNVPVIKWQKSSTIDFTNPEDIINTSTALTSTEIGAIYNIAYIRAVFENSSFSPTSTMSVGEKTTLIDNQWDNGFPNNTKTAVFRSNFTSTEDFIARSVLVENNVNVVISSEKNIILNGSLTVKEGSSFTLSNNSNIIQLTNAINTGNITVQKNSSKLQRLDYTLWSSPVKNQNIFDFSPLTSAGRFYTYNSASNQYNAIALPNTTAFTTAKAYLIRMPNNHPTVATVWNGSFEGVPNNGEQKVNLENYGIGKRFNLVGNPYPSALDAKVFVSENNQAITGSLYFWRKTNNAAKPSYCTWTAALGLISNGEAEVFDPNNSIASGQGFFVEALDVATELTFRNSQRIIDNSGQFFKSQDLVERHRIWLNATNINGAFSQMLLGYVANATVDVDNGIDGKFINDGVIALTSTINSIPFAIQGRPIPFETSDVVPLQFMATEAGQYTIAIDHVDGLFENDQSIYLKDQLTGNLQDLKTSSYIFNSDAGTFENRFTIVYQSPLSTNQFEQENNSVIVYQQNNQVIINSKNTPLKSVKIFDTLGRLVQEFSSINSTEIKIPARKAHQLLLLQITDENNQVIVKKLID